MSVSASTRGLRPGVCLSTNRPTTPYTGMMIFETDTNKLGVWNGSEWKFFIDVDTPPGLELVKTQTIGTAVSSVTVSDVFTSTYDAYKIIITGGVGSVNEKLGMQLGSSTTGYYAGITTVNYSGATTANASDNNATSWARAGRQSSSAILLNVDVINPYLAVTTTIFGQYITTDTGGGSGYVSGFHNVATSYTAFTLTPASGTLTGGTIRVYGYRNS